jgi:L-ascorbate metabolism protein UlaG (beta-lactamase superfamily)
MKKVRRPGRRRVLKWLGASGAVAAGGAFALTPARSNLYYSGPVSDHFDGYRFFNPGGPGPKGYRQLARWAFGTRAEAWPAAFESPFTDRPPGRVTAGRLRITHIGHASFLLQTFELNVLIDPVFAERASPISFVGPQRVNPPGIVFESLPRIDVVLVTHNHYDHMDTAFLGKLWRRDRPRFVTPLGNDTILRAEVSEGIDVRAVDWGDSVEIGHHVRAHAVPTQHWSARGTRDRQHALWASFVVETPAHVAYCIGDTGFGDGRTFRYVAERHPKIDVALLPIGAYQPRWFMRDQHINPEEAVKAFGIVRAARAIGHHWGTFRLTNEGIDHPREALAAALIRHGVDSTLFVAARPGEVVTLET